MIPIVNVQDHLLGNEQATVDAAAKVRDALENVGFFYLAGHGIDWSLVDQMYEEARRFHSLPEELKSELLGSPDATGYIPIKTSTSRASKIGGRVRKSNLVAGFGVNREYAKGQAPRFDGGAVPERVVWPPSRVLPGFRSRVTHYCRMMNDLGQRLLPLYAVALGLGPDHFFDDFVDAMWSFRLSHYPPVEAEDGQWGLAPHTDGGFLTFLPDNAVAALEIRPASQSEWIPAPSMPGTFLVNAGDALQRWSNGRFLSTEHRVLPSKRSERYALPFFFGPNATASIAPLLTPSRPVPDPAWSPMTYGEYYLWFAKQNYDSYAAAERLST
ncbi:MAG: isopenicillin N synthase family oxygenase [Gammaproteobacteria bacterium]|nr:isopenicillin N synthase family oxygenase [Gammaproteobacteria bacterium]